MSKRTSVVVMAAGMGSRFGGLKQIEPVGPNGESILDFSIYDAKRAEQEHMDANLKYHIEFFRNGLNAIIKLWLAGGCQESPEEMAEVLRQEYRGR